MKFWQKIALFSLALTLMLLVSVGYKTLPTSAQSASKLTLKDAGLTLEKVGLGVYALISSTDFPAKDPAKIAICNGGIILSGEGVMIIDPFQNAALGKLMLETAKGLSDAKVKYVVNTHFHWDHTGGNAAIAATDLPIIGRGEIRELMEKNNRERDPQLTPPGIVTEEALSLWLGDRQVKILPTEGHTPGTDLVVYVPDADILFTGDIVFNERIPYLGDGDIRKWQASLTQMLEKYPHAKIVPGHGQVSDRQALVQQKAYFDALENLALGWKKAGLTQAQVLQENATPPSPYNKYLFQAMYPNNLETAYRQITQVKP